MDYFILFLKKHNDWTLGLHLIFLHGLSRDIFKAPFLPYLPPALDDFPK